MLVLETVFSKLQNIKVIDDSISYSQYTTLDLSVSNSELSEVDLKNPIAFETFIENHLHKNHAKAAYGGYNELRNLYSNKSLFNNEQDDERNIHIGMDLWIKAGTAVLAALDGTVYGFENNIGKGNYGPTIILKHSLENQTFYTLYGHLSLDSIQNIEIGTVFYKGEKIASLGDSTVNGGYSPHLHFQIIKEISDTFGDYPGVCSKNNLNHYLKNCPDPDILLKIK